MSHVPSLNELTRRKLAEYPLPETIEVLEQLMKDTGPIGEEIVRDYTRRQTTHLPPPAFRLMDTYLVRFENLNRTVRLGAFPEGWEPAPGFDGRRVHLSTVPPTPKHKWFLTGSSDADPVTNIFFTGQQLQDLALKLPRTQGSGASKGRSATAGSRSATAGSRSAERRTVAFCVGCQSKQPLSAVERFTTANGHTMARGKCPRGHSACVILH